MAAAVKYVVRLSAEEREFLSTAARSNKRSVRERQRARILLMSDANVDDPRRQHEIARVARVIAQTVERVQQRFVEGGLEAAWQHKPQEKRKARIIDGVVEAHLIAVTCGAPPAGHKQWTLRLLRDTLIASDFVDTVSHETVRQTLKKTNLSRG